MKAVTILSLLLASSLMTAAPAPQTDGAVEMLGGYTYSHPFGGQPFQLTADGKYSSDTANCTTTYRNEGTYAVEDGLVVATVTSSKQWPHGRPEEAKEAEREDVEAARTRRLRPVRWGERLYLIDEDALLEFCNAVNTGIEPRRSFNGAEDQRAFDGAYLGAFYLREDDEQRSAVGLPQLPAAWREYLLEKPVEGVVTSIDGEHKAALNVGSRHGLRVGMRLVAFDEEEKRWGPPSLWSGIKVVSVEAESAQVEFQGKLRQGAKVSTRFTPPKHV